MQTTAGANVCDALAQGGEYPLQGPACKGRHGCLSVVSEVYGMAIMSRKVPCLVCNACRVVLAADAVRWLEPAWMAHVVAPLAAVQPWAQAPHLLNASGLPFAIASVCAKHQALERHAAHRGIHKCS